jgi:hypothetical protein
MVDAYYFCSGIHRMPEPNMKTIYQLILTGMAAGGILALTGCASDEPTRTTTTTTEETTVQPAATTTMVTH